VLDEERQDLGKRLLFWRQCSASVRIGRGGELNTHPFAGEEESAAACW